MGLVDEVDRGYDTRPLIVTLQCDDASQSFFDEQRTRFFPEAINFLAAHITLFHHLPGAERQAVAADLHHAAQSRSVFPVSITGLRNLGRGVAYNLESTSLTSLQHHLAGEWASWLTAQDRQTFRPHLTVQNKVDPAEARRTLAMLASTFEPITAQALGLTLWRYDGGPWTHLQTSPFRPVD